MDTTTAAWGVNDRTARVAGLLYLIVVVSGFFSLIYVPSQAIVPGNIAVTVASITSSKLLFQFGVVAGLTCYGTFLLLPLALYRLLRPTGAHAAALMVAFAMVSVPISFVNVGHRLDTSLVAAFWIPGLQVGSPAQDPGSPVDGGVLRVPDS